MHAKPPAPLSLCVALVLCTLVPGCIMPSAGRFTFLPQSHRLLESARALRDGCTGLPPVPRELDKHALPAYTVEPGDVLLIQPAELDSPVRLPADQPVMPDGSIHLGRYGRLVVAGKTPAEIEAEVQALVAAHGGDIGLITVRLVTRQSKVYYVLGDVNAPGAFPLCGRETVLDGILTAGGLTERASRRGILLSRPTHPDECRIVLPVCYPEIVQLGDTSTNYQLRPGDRIYVPSRSFWEEFCPWMDKKDAACVPCGRSAAVQLVPPPDALPDPSPP
jgi:protein involved in polysaccharide export with SLBB domain